MSASISLMLLIVLAQPMTPTPELPPPGGPSQPAAATPPVTRLLVLESGPAYPIAGGKPWQTVFAISESADAHWRSGNESGVLDPNERALFDAAYDAALAAVVKNGGIRHQQFHCRAMPTGAMRLTIGGRPIQWVTPCGDGPIAEVYTLMDMARAFAGDASMRYVSLSRPDGDEKHAGVIVIQGVSWMTSGPDGRRDGTVSIEDLKKLHALARAATFTLKQGAPATCTKPTTATRQELSAAPYGELRWALSCTDFLEPSSVELIALMRAITKG